MSEAVDLTSYSHFVTNKTIKPSVSKELKRVDLNYPNNIQTQCPRWTINNVTRDNTEHLSYDLTAG